MPHQHRTAEVPRLSAADGHSARPRTNSAPQSRAPSPSIALPRRCLDQMPPETPGRAPSSRVAWQAGRQVQRQDLSRLGRRLSPLWSLRGPPRTLSLKQNNSASHQHNHREATNSASNSLSLYKEREATSCNQRPICFRIVSIEGSALGVAISLRPADI